MADDQKKKPVTGGNTPKPPARPGGAPNQSAKERSKAQSRPVSGKSPTGKSGQATGRAKSAAGGRRREQAPAGRQARARSEAQPLLRCRVGLGRGGPGHRHRGRAGRGQGGHRRLVRPHHLHAGDGGARLRGQGRHQHPGVGLRQGGGQLPGGRPARVAAHHAEGPAGAVHQGQVAGHALLRGRVLPVLRSRALGHRRRAGPVRDLVRPQDHCIVPHRRLRPDPHLQLRRAPRSPAPT